MISYIFGCFLLSISYLSVCLGKSRSRDLNIDLSVHPYNLVMVATEKAK